MLITESQLGTGFSRSGMSLLENMSYLTEEESQYHAAMVPVVENARIGANVVALEDIMKFSESNGIEDLGYALSCVCEASGIEANTIVFSVQETSVIADAEVASLTRDIMNEGVAIAAVPLSEHHPASILAEAAVNRLLNTGDSSLLEAYVNDDLGVFVEDGEGVLNAPVPQRERQSAENYEKQQKAAAQQKEDEFNAHYANSKTGPDGKPNPNYAAPANVAATESMLEKIKKNAVNKPRDWVAAKIASLNAKMRDVINAANAAAPDKKGILLTIKKKLAQAIEWLTRHMNNLMVKAGAKDDKGNDMKHLDKMA